MNSIALFNPAVYLATGAAYFAVMWIYTNPIQKEQFKIVIKNYSDGCRYEG